ncbi:hypothetical protein ANRL4_01502 [Anaerolineae bacterium]|nr:hypothetical protein ANRL4_01502 [Anaerolineae bacterium]
MGKTHLKTQTMNLNTAPLISFDLGNATSKGATEDKQGQFRTIYGRFSRASQLGRITSPLVFQFQDATWVFGDEARDLCDGEPSAFTDMTRYSEGFYRVLVAAMLNYLLQDQCSNGVIYPLIVCSIPATEFAAGIAETVKSVIQGDYEITSVDGDRTLYVVIKPENVTIIPEGAGSYFYGLKLTEGLGAQEVAVLDVGFYTSDLVIFNRKGYVPGSARSCKHGVRFVAEAVQRHLRRTEGYHGDLWAVDSALDVGMIALGNRCVEFSAARDEAYRELLSNLEVFYRSNKGSRTPGIVLLSGGGATGVYKQLPKNLIDSGWRVVSGDPRRANVDGGLLFLKERQQRKANGSV